MRHLFAGAILGSALLLSSAAMAAEKTVKLSIPGMNCASCPYMVKQAISTVDGIKSVTATMEDRSATVTFDEAVATIAEIQQATAEIGYPSTVVK